MALFEVIIPSILTTNIISNNQKTNVLILAVFWCCPGMDWGPVQCFMQNQPRQAPASCDCLMTVTRCWWKKCFSEEWKSTESSICSPHAVLQLILSSAVQIHKALTKYCSLRSARHLIIFLLNWASLFWWSLSTWFHIFVPPCSVRMSSDHT